MDGAADFFVATPAPNGPGESIAGTCARRALRGSVSASGDSQLFVPLRGSMMLAEDNVRRKVAIMAGSTPTAPGRIFVSYRRQDTSGIAGRLHDRLAERFGARRVFIDVDSIEPGLDFAESIERAVDASEVLLAVIGPQWLTITDEVGHRRLDDSDDVVRLEIEAALRRGIRVVPLLVEGARMPRRQELPESLGSLAHRHGLTLRHESFHDDSARLLKALDKILAEEQPKPDDDRPPPGPSRANRFWRRIGRRGQVLVVVVLAVAILGLLVLQLPISRFSGSETPETSVPAAGGATTTTLDKGRLKSTMLQAVVVPFEDSCSIQEDVDPILTGSLLILDCESNGIDVVRFGLFADRAALLDAYNRTVSLSGVERNSGALNCAKRPSEGTWNRAGNKSDVGHYLCYVDQSKRVWVHWTYDTDKVYAYAYKRNGTLKAVDDWWTKN